VLGIGNIEAAVPEKCDVRLFLTLEPDVPNPRDPGFLSALLADPLYQLVWIRGTNTTAEVELTGPGPEYRCMDEVKRLSRAAHVLDVKVLSPNAEKDAEDD
jgi:hypothetical protein